MTTASHDLHGDPSEGTLDIHGAVMKMIHHKWLILAITVLATSSAGLYSYSRDPVFTARAQILVRPILVQPLQPNPLDNLSMPTEAQLVTSTQVAQIALGTLELQGGPGDLQDLIDRVSVETPESTQILQISFTDGDPRVAAAGAQAFADAYLAFKSSQAVDTIARLSDTIGTQITRLGAEVTDIEDQLAALDPVDDASQLESLQAERDTLETSRLVLQNQLATVATLSADPGTVVQPAVRPTSPVSPKHQVDLALGFLLGLLGGIALASAREQLRDRVQSPALLERTLGAPTLGSIPRSFPLAGGSVRLALMEEPRGLAAEAYRTLRINLMAACRESRAKSLLVVSADPGDGKTTTVANLGVSLAQAGRSVVLVSADLRYPSLHTSFGIDGTVGLGQVLSGTCSLKDALADPGIVGLRVIPSGRVVELAEASELLQSDRMRDVIRACREADFVLIDGPPVKPVADSLVLADLVDGILFVSDAQRSTVASIAQSRHQLEQVGGRILGGILNRAHVPWSSNGYGGYGEYNGYDRTSTSTHRARSAATPPDVVQLEREGSETSGHA